MQQLPQSLWAQQRLPVTGRDTNTLHRKDKEEHLKQLLHCVSYGDAHVVTSYRVENGVLQHIFNIRG